MRIACFFILLIVSNLSPAQRISHDELTAAYIYKLADNINWPIDSFSDFHIHVVEEQDRISNYLLNITKDRKLENKNIRVTHSFNMKIPSNTQVIYISKDKLYLYSDIYDEIKNKSTLIISKNFDNKRKVMINLYENKNKEIHFEINKANIINHNLSVNPDIIFEGGTEIDVAKLYKESQETLRSQDERLEKIEILNTKLEKQSIETKEKILTLQDKFKIQNKDFVKQTGKLIATTQKVNSQKKILNEQKTALKDLLIQAKKQENIINSRSQELSEQQLEIANRTQTLNSQQNNITHLSSTIILQEKQIERQVNTLKAKNITILSQKNGLYLLSIIIVIVLLFIAYIFKSRRKYKLLSNELKIAKDKADYANSSKTIFLANMNHELRTPLNVILGFSEILIKNITAPKQKSTLEIIIKSGNNLLSLINHVLALAKIESGKIEIHSNPFDLKSLVDDTMNSMTHKAQEKGLTLLLNPSEKFPRYIDSDSIKLNQILLNLISNAIKYSIKGTIIVSLNAKDDILTIEVKDEGVGISENDLGKVFEAFQQVGNASEKTGTGLGLSIVKKFSELLGGDVGVNSELNVGSTFWFKLPYKKIQKSDIENKNIIKNIIGLDSTQQHTKVLIVEDQEYNRLLLRTLLEVLKIEIKEAVNGQEAVEIFKEWQPDYIWMDRRMPIMGGEKATQVIRKLPHGDKVIIVALTASAIEEERKTIMESGMNDLVAKPYHPQDIYMCMEKHLNFNYIYKDEITQLSNFYTYTSDELKEELLTINKTLLRELFESAKLLNIDIMGPTIAQVGLSNKKLANILIELIKNYNYETIIKALESILDE